MAHTETSPRGLGDSPSRRTAHESLRVFVRIRPSHKPSARKAERDVLQADEQTVVIQDPFCNEIFLDERTKSFRVDGVLQSDASNLDVYKSALQPWIPKALEGFNTCCFAFGMTGAGKTHTMLGDLHEVGRPQRGLSTLAVDDIFAQLEDKECKLMASFFEIYNENVVDLLTEEEEQAPRSPSPPRKPRLNSCSFSSSPSVSDYRSPRRGTGGGGLKILEDPKRGVFVKDLSAHPITSAAELKQLIERGHSRRTMAPTVSNQVSSRSHALLQIFIERRQSVSSSLTSKLSLIDLAGSERGAAVEARSQRSLQGSNINKSLLALCSCITQLSERSSSHVPFRNSKLTHLLKDSLGGSTRTVMLACISALSEHYEETLSTLKYAERARLIQADLVANVKSTAPSTMRSSHFASLIENLETEISELKRQFSEKFKSVPPPEIVLRVRGADSLDRSSMFYLSRSEGTTGAPDSLESPGPRTNASMIERISGLLVKNIEEFVEHNRTLSELKYEKQCLEGRVDVGGGGQRDELETNAELMEELQEALSINLKQRATLEKMLSTLNQQNTRSMREDAKHFRVENMQLKLKNMQLKLKNKQLQNQNFILSRRNNTSSEDGTSNDYFAPFSDESCVLLSERPSPRPVEQSPEPQKLEINLAKVERVTPVDTLRTNEEESEFNIQAIVTPLPNRDRIVAPSLPSSEHRPRNSITLTVPLESETSRLPGAKAQLKLGHSRPNRAQTEEIKNELEMTHASKMETVMNEEVDLRLNMDRSYSSNDTVNIGSQSRPVSDCSSVNFLSPMVSKDTHALRLSRCSTPAACVGTEDGASKMLPQPSERKPAIFPFRVEGPSSSSSSQRQKRPFMAQVAPKMAESGTTDLHLINSGEMATEAQTGPLVMPMSSRSSGSVADIFRSILEKPRHSRRQSARQFVSYYSRGPASTRNQSAMHRYANMADHDTRTPSNTPSLYGSLTSSPQSSRSMLAQRLKQQSERRLREFLKRRSGTGADEEDKRSPGRTAGAGR